MPTKDKIPEFRFEDLLAGMQQGADHAAGKITVRTHRLTARAAFMTGDEIASIRSKLNVSQAVFADLLNVPKATAIAWERGLRSPSGAAVRLLQIARENPEALIEATGRGH